MNWRAGPSFRAPRRSRRRGSTTRCRPSFIPERGSRPDVRLDRAPSHPQAHAPRRGHHDVAEPEPVRHQAQLVAEGGAMSLRRRGFLRVDRVDQQAARRTVGLEIEAGDDVLAQHEGQAVIAVFAPRPGCRFRCGSGSRTGARCGCAPTRWGRRAIPGPGRRSGAAAWPGGRDRSAPASLDRDGHEVARLDQLRDAHLRVGGLQPEIVAQAALAGDAERPDRQTQQLARASSSDGVGALRISGRTRSGTS